MSRPLNYFKDINRIKNKFILQTIILFERKDHFGLLFQSTFKSNDFMMDKFNLNLIKLIEENKVPLT